MSVPFMNASSPTVAQTSWWSRVPTFLKLWVGLGVVSPIVSRAIDPVFEWSWPRAVGGVIFTFLLGITMLRHSKGAWFVAAFFAALGLVGAPGYMDESRAFAIWGLVVSSLDLGILLSPQARNWVNQPTERKWTYTPRKERGRLRVWRCTNCGDTFPSSDLRPTCPSCSGNDLEPASEPML
jgi:hypothetical protein